MTDKHSDREKLLKALQGPSHPVPQQPQAYNPPSPAYQPYAPPPAWPQQPSYPAPQQQPPTPAFDGYLDLAREIEDHGAKDISVTGIVARALTDTDLVPRHDLLGQVERYQDGKLKKVLIVPLLIKLGYPVPPGALTGWLVYGRAVDELARAMETAEVPAEPGVRGRYPQPGATITLHWQDGKYQVGYARPDQESLQAVTAWQVVQDMSPIERPFWDAHLRLKLPALEGLVPQFSVLGGKYRLDFALPKHKIGIELDGFATHSSTADIAHDRKRQREIEAAGWYIIRFGGSEVHHDAEDCARQAARLAQIRLEGR